MSNAEDRKAYEAESQQLRQELKAWETAWAREHGGAKPGRNDIKRHPDIAQKYTAYNRVRNLLAGKEAPASDAKTAAKSREIRRDEDGTARRKRKQPATYDASGQLHTPSKRRRSTETPRKAGAAAAMAAAAAADTVTPATARKLFSPVVPTSIGPTPQRDGRILGLFDVLSEEKKTHPTPSKRHVLEGTGATGPGAVPFALTGIAATPRAQTRTIDVETDMEETRRLGRTPMSPAKRNLLAQFAGPAPTSTPRATYQPLGTTPLKTRDANIQLPPPSRVFSAQPFSLTTPSKKDDAPQPFATPAFLRRTSTRPLPPSSSLPVDENGEFLSPPGRVWLPRKPLVRGLSSVLASLRRMEDEQLDDELDVLRDLEREEEEAGKRNGAAATTTTMTKSLADDADAPGQGSQPTQAKTADVLDRQRMQPPPSPSPHAPPLRLLGGFDDDGLYDSPPEDQAGRDGQPLRVFKKKGQKRTTRLVHMRPTRTKRPALGAMAKASDDEDDEDDDNDDGVRTEDKQGNEDDVMPETQVAAEDASGSEFGSGGEDDEPARKQVSKTKTKKKATEKKATGTSRGGKEGTVRKAVRKVNELAHANFKRLKLRNNGAKGGPGFNSRFRRRR